MGNLHLVTGHAGTAHVTAADHGSFNAAIFGDGNYVLNRGSQFATTTISNNCIRVADGDILFQGRHIRLNEGTYVDMTVENGSQGNYRNDLIVARYTKDSVTGLEDCTLVVIKGNETTGTATDPEYTVGDIINDHALVADMPLYRIPLNGLNVQTLVPLFEPATLIPDGSVTSAKLAENAVTKSKLASNSVSTAKLENSSVTNAKLADGAVNASKIADGAVTTAKLASSSVSAAKLADSAVTKAKIASKAVTTEKIADDAITLAKLGSDVTDFVDDAEKTVLIWENAKPTSTFKEQQISVSCSKYKGIFVSFLATTAASSSVSSGFIPKSDGKYVAFYFSDSGTIMKRSVTCYSGNVTVYGGVKGGSDDDTVLIPTKIYGVK